MELSPGDDLCDGTVIANHGPRDNCWYGDVGTVVTRGERDREENGDVTEATRDVYGRARGGYYCGAARRPRDEIELVRRKVYREDIDDARAGGKDVAAGVDNVERDAGGDGVYAHCRQFGDVRAVRFVGKQDDGEHSFYYFAIVRGVAVSDKLCREVVGEGCGGVSGFEEN